MTSNYFSLLCFLILSTHSLPYPGFFLEPYFYLCPLCTNSVITELCCLYRCLLSIGKFTTAPLVQTQILLLLRFWLCYCDLLPCSNLAVLSCFSTHILVRLISLHCGTYCSFFPHLLILFSTLIHLEYF